MRTEHVHTLILGAGPSGLAAGYALAKAGLKPVVLERAKVCGGLMGSIKRGDFVLDIGRKELYNRIAKVDALWSQILGPDYRDYPHRGGILYDGLILDMSPAYSGFRRGMPWGMFLGCGFDLVRSRLLGGSKKPANVEEYFYRHRGRQLTQIAAQGFQEKLTGKKWADIPMPENHSQNGDAGLITTIKELIVRVFSKKEVNTFKGIWRHPAKGTGQICDTLAQGILDGGGRIHYESKVLEIGAAEGVVNTITAEAASETIVYKPTYLVSSIPLEFLMKLLFPQRSDPASKAAQASVAAPRTVVLVYLFLNEEPKFPHAWLQVTDTKTRIGRITNYSAFNGTMVPKGKTCLCCEFYCFGPDPLLEMKNEEIAKLALEQCAQFKLLDPSKCFDQLVLRFPGADASQNRDNWMSKARLQLLAELKPFKNLYYVNRTETDLATLAGVEAAEAIVAGNRTEFDLRLDPAQLQIRSEPKAFEFKVPSSGPA
jgi:protoporphyrinogen oxidase